MLGLIMGLVLCMRLVSVLPEVLNCDVDAEVDMEAGADLDLERGRLIADRERIRIYEFGFEIDDGERLREKS